jgi:serine/threonine protein kinase
MKPPLATADAADDSLLGTLFAGRFRIESRLGSGGMGAVYLARHEVLQRRFALKVIRKELLADVNIAARFRREARAASRIDHPNVMRIFDFGHAEGGRPYLAMELVDGPTLARVIATQGPLPVPRVLEILAQIADALAAAHAVGVIHRDLKPANVVIARRGDGGAIVKVLDFGLAKIVGARGTAALTAQGSVFGTPEYLAPERCTEEGDPDDPRGDLYSLGVMAFELLVGEVPFRGKLVQVLAAHIGEAPPAPSRAARREDIPPALDEVVLRCLAKLPAERYASASALRAALATFRADGARHDDTHHDVVAVPPTPTPTLPPAELFETMPSEPPVAPEEPTSAAPRPATEPPGRALGLLEELVYALRDEGWGSPELCERLAVAAEAHDALAGVEGRLAASEQAAGDLEMTARLREARLTQVLNQLEYEVATLAAEGRAAPELERLRQRIAALTRRITQIGFELAEQLDALEERANRDRQRLGPARAEAAQQLRVLQDQLARGLRALGGECPPALRELLAQATIAARSGA